MHPRQDPSRTPDKKYSSTTNTHSSPHFSVTMQKVIRRSLLAERQAQRRIIRRRETVDRQTRKTNREQNLYQRSQDTKLIRDAKLYRREDWELGPLAPRRDVGDNADKYGTLGQGALRGPLLEKAAREKARECIGGRYMNIVQGDRVVLLDGRDKGKIGKIIAVDTQRCEFTVEGLNMVCTTSHIAIAWSIPF